jgi:hypothetical protein
MKLSIDIWFLSFIYRSNDIYYYVTKNILYFKWGFIALKSEIFHYVTHNSDIFYVSNIYIVTLFIVLYSLILCTYKFKMKKSTFFMAIVHLYKFSLHTRGAIRKIVPTKRNIPTLYTLK